MNGRGFFRLLALLLLVAVAIGLGSAAYNAGVSAGLNEAAQAAASGAPVTVVPYGYGPYWHGPWGFGFFGFFFWIFAIFLVFGLVRAVFGWGRWSDRGPGRGWGPRGGRGEMVEAWHRELHRRENEPGGDAAP